MIASLLLGSSSSRLQLLFAKTILLEGSHECCLVGRGLETSVSQLGAGVDELQVDGLEGGALGVNQERLAQGDDALLGSDAATLDHQEVVVNFSVEGETSHWSDRLVGDVVFGRSVVLDDLAILGVDASADAVDLLVDLGTVMVTFLTSASDGEGNTRWMPSSDTSDLAETLVSLARKFLRVPTAGDTLETFTLGDGNAIDHFVLSKDARDWDGLLQMFLDPLDLVFNGSTVKLDFHDVSLLLALLDQTDLGVNQDANDLAVTDHLVEVIFDGLLAQVVGPLLAGLGESLLLARVPVLVKTATALLAQMLSPDIDQSARSMWSFDVTDGSNNDDWRSFEDGDGLNNFLLVDL